jgi:hypothetical protein
MQAYDHGRIVKFPVRLTDPAEKRHEAPEDRAEIGRWLELADVALFKLPADPRKVT